MQLNKGIILSLLVLIFIGYAFSQMETTGKIEAALITDYRISDNTFNFFVTSTGPIRWDDNGFLTDNYFDASLYDIPEQTNLVNFAWYGWNFDGSSTPTGNLTKEYENICFGLFKMKWSAEYPFNNIVTDSFYLDLRDDRYPGTPYYLINDFYIKLDENLASNRFSYMKCTGTYFTTITTGSTITIWTILDVSAPPSHIHFQPTTPTNLSYSWSGSRVNLIWYHSEPISAARYEVWRKIMGGARYTQTIEDWTLICTNSAGDTTHLDREFYLGSGYKAYYKIRAVSGDGNLYSPGWSNEISIIGNFLPLDRQPSQQKLSIDTTPRFNLFPNPFNSTIRIYLYSPSEEISEIDIYDLQGRIVKIFDLISGKYYFDTIWNGSDNQGQPIQSGIYFLIAHNGSKTLFNQKIIYLK